MIQLGGALWTTLNQPMKVERPSSGAASALIVITSPDESPLPTPHSALASSSSAKLLAVASSPSPADRRLSAGTPAHLRP